MNLRRSFFSLIVAGLVSTTSYAADWAFDIEPYGLLATIDGTAGIGRAVGAPVEVGFDDILENLDMAGMLHFEAHHESGWGLILDYGFMDLGADINGPRGGVVDASVRQGILEAFVLKRSEKGANTIDYYGGIRWWDNDIDVDIDLAVLPGALSGSIDEDWVDFVVGARWQRQLNTKWRLYLSGDIGTGGADITTSLSAGFRYQMSEKWTLDLRYRGLWVDYEDGSAGDSGYFAYDTVTYGPLIGFSYRF